MAALPSVAGVCKVGLAACLQSSGVDPRTDLMPRRRNRSRRWRGRAVLTVLLPSPLPGRLSVPHDPLSEKTEISAVFGCRLPVDVLRAGLP